MFIIRPEKSLLNPYENDLLGLEQIEQVIFYQFISYVL